MKFCPSPSWIRMEVFICPGRMKGAVPMKMMRISSGPSVSVHGNQPALRDLASPRVRQQRCLPRWRSREGPEQEARRGALGARDREPSGDEGWVAHRRYRGPARPPVAAATITRGRHLHRQEEAHQAGVDRAVTRTYQRRPYGSTRTRMHHQADVRHALYRRLVVLERETGLEPATFCLGSRHSTD